MPVLNWLGKDKIINHHSEVPYKVLNRTYSFDEKNGKTAEDNKSENMIIHGDNLLALKSLLPKYEEMVDVIYIDPPYNTAHSTSKNQKWVYSDNVDSPVIKKWLGQTVGDEGDDLSRHDKWLCMMYPRLKLLHLLLKNQGVIFISCDDNEFSSLKLICDEILGKNNFITTIHWRRTESQNNTGKLIAVVGEYIFCYIKNKNKDSCFDKIPLKDSASNEYRYSDEKGFFRRGTIVDATRGKNMIEIVSPNGIKKTIKSIRTLEWIKEQESLNLIYWTKTGTPYSKIYKDDSEGQICNNWFDDTGVNEDAQDTLTQMGIQFDYSKPKELIQQLLKLKNNKDAIILDSFAGSGTTAHAVLDLNKQDGGNRKFILVEMEDYADSITAERVKKVIEGYGSGNDKVDGINGNFSFYELGDTIFKNGILNENIDDKIIKEYIYWTETKKDPIFNDKEPYFLGKDNETAYYMFYKKSDVTTLDIDFLKTIRTKADKYVIYADILGLTDDELKIYNITFKKIPRDIKKI